MKKLISLFLVTALCAAAAPVTFAEGEADENAAAMEAITEDAKVTEAAEPEDIAAHSEEEAEAETAQPEEADNPAEPQIETAAAEKAVNITYDGIKVDLYPAPYLDGGTAMVPIRQLAEYIGFDVEFNADYNVEILSLGKNNIYYNIDTDYTTAFGTDLASLKPTVIANGTVFVALRTFADIIGSELDVTDYGTSLTINMRNSVYVNEYFINQPVNPWGINSRTDYMVWVSLSQYTVRLYHGKQYMWKLIHECPCAIGAPATPTVTGSFEYQYKTQWNYDGYYVGPCLVFYRGYALHSVLLRYNNTEYDGRTGVQISHGCVRMKKYDIDLIASKIPVGTRIYITR